MPRTPLPIDAALPELLAALGASGAAVLHAPPGAGKTTRVPPALAAWIGVDPGRQGQVVVLEPRRVAARAAARRIADEQGWTVGREVGWWIRFERRFRPDSRIVFATEGVLLRWMQRDPFLEGVAALVFDEFHERTLAADLSLALARRVRREVRPELALVVMSATLDVAPVASYLEDAAVVRSAGRLYPVETRLLDRPDNRPLEQQVAAAVRKALSWTGLEIGGDLLVFLPGMAEIRRAEEALAPWAAERGVALLPLHCDLPAEAQDAALRRSAGCRVVLATNVAETSITVEGVRAVIDSGLARQLRFDPATGLDRLETIRIARAAADQRAGRAGREGPGLCLRLWSAADDLALRPFEPPEVRRVDLAGAVLDLASWGERDPAKFDWFEAPEPARLARAVASLRDLGAIDPAGAITPLGRRLATLPLAPRLGRLVLEGERLGVGEEAALVAALLSERGAGRGAGAGSQTGDRSAPSDLLLGLEALDRRRNRPLFEAQRQVVELLRRSGDSLDQPASTMNDAATWAPAEERLLRAISAAYLDRLCRRRERGADRALMVGGRGVRLAKSSAVKDAELFVAVELDAGRVGERSEGFVRAASAVERAWLPAELTRPARELAWDEERARVVARVVVRFDDLELESSEIPIGDPEAAASLLAERAASELGRALALDRPEIAALLQRLRFLARARPELALPADDRELAALLSSLLSGLCSGRKSFDELARAPVAETLLAALTWQQRAALDAEAPERLEVPSGSRIRIDYSDPERPVLAARIQELFGLSRTPTVAAGRVSVLVHLLAPSGRPQQVTHDLASFWKNTYPIVKRELAARYPKHAWPDDPTTAKAERGPKRRPRA